ncbi:hypothetical protein P3X46_033119 [Hevea brasiliensis]|uniref:Uncharacterized protein n=1 Tax=Hevea brasiliensis TaxID=3981 RepID=A0ABQ9KFB8_HEVBR|nr:precursor of CEP14-like [Hevea brasiliensis]XP_057997137.1 precursor of CEP14-like [Hevea brasiliensis]KAJ9136003.1 hypothetical protein P3X46_033119 [Hevea brasiliensis]
MARSTVLALIFLVPFAAFLSNIEGRKLLMTDTEEYNKKEVRITVPSLFESLFFSALPKGTVPSSSPSNKGHATLDNEQLFQRHLASIDRILQSVPSPGVGH